MDLVKALAIGLKAKLYFKEFNKITESVHCSLFLGQLIYWADKNDYKPFYKFRQPCQHELYKEGDSWAEELDFEIRMIDKCIKTLKELGILETKTTIQRVTFYELKIEKLNEILSKNAIYENSQNVIYKENSENAIYENSENAIYENSENAIYKENCKNAIYENSQNAILLHNTNNTNSKTTTNTTKKSEADATHLGGRKSQKVFLSVADKPSFVSPDIWQDFCQYKKERKESYTQTGLKAFLSKLEKINAKGANVNEALLETMANNWRGVFEPKQGFNAKSKAEGVKKSRQVLREWAAKKMAAEKIIDGEVIDDNARIQCGF